MKYCPVCNAPNPGDSLFCSSCGRSFSNEGAVYSQPGYSQQGFPPNPPSEPLPYYAPPVMPLKPGDPAKDWMSILAMIMGILSILSCCIWFLVPIFGIMGIVFGILGRKSRQRGMAAAGIVTGSVGLAIIALFFVLVLIGSMDGMDFNYLGDFFSDIYDSLKTFSLFPNA